MSNSLNTTLRVNALARQRGAASAIVQFDALATQAQYRLPYEITSRYVKSGDRVLDWGCGNGHFSLFLELLGAKITGYSYEPPPVALSGSAQFEFVSGIPDDPSSLPFPDGSFDAVAGVGVLEHVYELGGDESASLREIARVLRPGGVFLTFHFPNQGGWIEKVVHGLRLKKHFHKRKYTEAQIRELWTGAGLEVVELGLYNSLPRAELRALPGALKRSPGFAAAYDAVDRAIGRVAPGVCTNFYVVGRR